MNYLSVFLMAFMLAYFLSPLSIKLSEKWGVLSKPKKGERKGKPCLGGAAIVISFAVTIFLECLFIVEIRLLIMGLLVALACIALLGIIDDVRELDKRTRIIVEVLAIGIVIASGIVTKIAYLPMWVNMGLTVVWMLFITNAFNLLDIMDGLTSGIVIIISSTLLVITVINMDIFSSVILLALLGTHMGFLRYNYPPAKLHMGDTGSLFSGFVLAAVAINISYAPLERPMALLTPIVAMSLPIYDTLFVIIMRIKTGKFAFAKSDDHFVLRLKTMGHDGHKSVWLMYLFSLFLAVASLIVAFGNNTAALSTLVVTGIIFVLVGKKVALVQVKD